jgi:chloramphenicol-sensitive protein RarD
MASSPIRTPPPTPASESSGYAFALFSSLGGSLATVIGKWNLEVISPLLLNCLIFSIAAVLFAAVLLPARGPRHLFCHSPRGWLWIGLFGATSVGALWAFWAGVQRMDPSLASLINRIEVFVTILLAVIFLRERLNRMELLGAAISIAGIIVMRATLRVEYSSGFWLVLVGSVFFGITEFVSKIAVRYVASGVLACLRSALMAFVFWLVFWAVGEDFTGLQRVWPGVVALAVVGPIVARMAYLAAVRRIPVTKAAIVTQTSPVFVMVLAVLLLGQFPTLRELAGGILVLVGCVVMILARGTVKNHEEHLPVTT